MNKITCYFEIILLITAVVSFSYIIHENLNYNNSQKDNFLTELLAEIGNILFGIFKNASAASLTADDLEQYVCPLSKDNKKCVTYVKAECNSHCSKECIKASQDNECKIGVCFDSSTGICSKNSPRGECELNSGQWFNNPSGNIPQCMKGCCILNGNPEFTTEQECSYKSEKSGIKKDFRSEITNQLACEILEESSVEGACIFEKQPFNECLFTTKENCQVRRGKFKPNILCSNPSLNTECRAQSRTSCIEGKDEVYWMDSCGNKENIYDFTNKAKLKADGKIISKQQGCDLPSPTDPRFREKQKTCGNCNYLLGSVCGKKTEQEKLIDNSGYVCKDISCIDENEKKRANGESWCRYQGAVGEDKNRAVDTPGSNHFKVRCENGEVITEQCGNNRERICVESKNPSISGGTFSSAQCITNLGALCMEYNNLDGEQKTKQCQKNPHCFIKKVSVSEKFSFELCAPKYKSGSDRDNNEYNEAKCGIVNNLKCKYIKVKKLSGKKEINKECFTESFTRQMNDLCISLGDCGAQSNYIGDLTENYRVDNAPRLSNSYLGDIKRYNEEKLFKNNYAKTEDSSYFGIIGIPGDLGNAQIPDDSTASFLKQGGTIAGATGTLLPLIAHTQIGALALSKIGLGATYGQAAFTSPNAASLSAFGGALAGAAVGFSLTSFLISFTGVGRGLPPAVTYSLMAAGTIGGALAGKALITGGFKALGAGAGAGGLITLAAVIIVIFILKMLGIGKVKQRDVSFTCKPWQPVTGGKNCGKCGTDGFPCTKSSCESLGMTCELINEEENPECIDIAPDDITPPILKATDIFPDSYNYEEKDFEVKIKGQQECIEETYSPVYLQLQANEPARCRMSVDSKESWEEMEYLAGKSSFIRNHTLPITIPSLESLGLSGFDPNAKSDVRINIFCEDKSGNKNSRAHIINFCVKQGNDTIAPRVIDREPLLEEIKIDSISVNASIYTNEPADCKWDSNDKKYNEMAFDMDCKNEIEDYTLQGFKCDALFPVTNNEQIFYVSCKDQPWHFGENESKRNTMPSSYQFKVKKVSTPLTINNVKPFGEIIEAESEPVSVNIQAETSGGYNGQAQCFYKYKDSINEFSETFSNLHKNTFDYFLSGNIEIPIYCKDIIGNVAESSSKFTIKLDATPPKVTRVYNRAGILNIITEKAGRCSYSNDESKSCSFQYENGTEMSGAGLTHSTSIQKGKTYYIKCKNKFNKVAGACSIIVKTP